MENARVVDPDEAALDAATGLLLRARLPLVWGLTDTTVEAQQAAVELADLLGAAVDSAASSSHAASLLAFQQVGVVAATLGEIRARADLLVFWGVDPDAAHPGFRDRYTPPALDVPARLEIAVDVGDARGPAGVRERVSILPEREFEALAALRALIRGRRVEESRPEALGAPLEVLRSLAARLAACRYGVILHDGDPPPERRDPLRSTALHALVVDASEGARLRLIGIRMPGNPVGAENVLTWQTGFPFAVHLGRGYPRYGPGEFTAEALLSRGDADAALIVGVHPPGGLSDAALDGLRRIPTVVVGSPASVWMREAEVALSTAPLETTPGSTYRMDGVPLRQRGSVPPGEPTDEGILTRLVERVRRSKFGGDA